MGRIRLDMMGMSLERLTQQVPGGNAEALVRHAVRHGTTYSASWDGGTDPLFKEWELEIEALELVSVEVPELADECERQIRTLNDRHT